MAKSTAEEALSPHASMLLLQKENQELKAEIVTLRLEIERLKGEVKQIPHLIKTARKLSRLASHDQMTGLFNRAHLFEELKQRLKKAGRDVHLEQSVLVMFDLIGFKQLNDRLGQSGGDLVIQQMADVFKRQFRQSDLYGRIGGDELMAYLENMPEEKLMEIFDSFNNALEKCDPPLRAYCAFVRCQYGESMDALYARASQALSDEKKRVRGY